MYFDGTAMLTSVGLSWDDVDVVPVASFRDGMQALIEGRADVALASVGSGLTEQAEASLGGVRFLSLPSDEDASERMWRQQPGFHAVAVPTGAATGVKQDLVLAGKEAYLTASADTSDDAVYGLDALLWERVDELASVHPIFGRWTRQVMSNPRVTIPFHAGTVRFLREMGAWTDAHEEIQRRLLAELSR